MDCKTARLFLQFHRPSTGDLDGSEAEELEHHLAHCTECNALASAQRRLDQHFGRAMRAVEVPPRLRADVLDALARQRRTWYRHWFDRTARGAAAAAAVLLVVGLSWYFWYTSKSSKISPDAVLYSVNYAPLGRDSANDALKRLGEGAFAPPFVNYAYLTAGPALAELPGYRGVKVPQFVFTNPRVPNSCAVIFLLDLRRFPIDEVDTSESGRFNIEVYPHNERDRVGYLVMYSGDSWEWLKAREPVE
jgi:hypothetical protein